MYECPKCFKEFKNKIPYQIHLNKKFDCSNKFNKKCIYCLKKFNNKDEYDQHLKVLTCRQNTKEIQVQTQINNDIFKHFIPNFLFNFINQIYPILDNNNFNDFNSNEVKPILEFFNKLSSDEINNLFNVILKKNDAFGKNKIYLFYLIIQKNLNYFKDPDQMLIWNKRIYHKLNSNKIQFE